jgi:hypothetical protein
MCTFTHEWPTAGSIQAINCTGVILHCVPTRGFIALTPKDLSESHVTCLIIHTYICIYVYIYIYIYIYTHTHKHQHVWFSTNVELHDLAASSPQAFVQLLFAIAKKIGTCFFSFVFWNQYVSHYDPDKHALSWLVVAQEPPCCRIIKLRVREYDIKCFALMLSSMTSLHLLCRNCASTFTVQLYLSSFCSLLHSRS